MFAKMVNEIFFLSWSYAFLQFWDDPRWRRKPLPQNRREHHVPHPGRKQWSVFLVHLQQTVPQPLSWVGPITPCCIIHMWGCSPSYWHCCCALFPRTAQASCLGDEPKQIGQYKYPEQLPGQLYDADTQCKWQFGSKTKLCSLDFVKVVFTLLRFSSGISIM